MGYAKSGLAALLLLVVATGCESTSPFVGEWETEEHEGVTVLVLEDGTLVGRGGAGGSLEAEWEAESENLMRWTREEGQGGRARLASADEMLFYDPTTPVPYRLQRRE